MCNCASYNACTGGDSDVILAVPEGIRAVTDGRKTVCIDACIADVITALWMRDLPTLNSCCGHNTNPAGIVIPELANPADYLTALREIDPDRVWIVSRWEMARVGYSTHELQTPLSTCAIAPERVYTLLCKENAMAQALITEGNSDACEE